jgi:hypothetical protein
MATVTNQAIKFALLQSVLATYIGKIYNSEEMAQDYASKDHDALISAVWAAFLNGQYERTVIDTSICNKVAMIKALRARVQGVVKLTVKLPAQWGTSFLRDSIIDNTCYHSNDSNANNELREYHYQKSIGLKDAKDFCDWMVALMLDQ